MIISLSIVVLGDGIPFGRSKAPEIEIALERDRLEAQVSQLRTELAKLKRETLDAKGSVTAVDVNDPDALRSRVAGVEMSARDLLERLERLEGAITDDAEKALSLPMLRKDLDSYDERFERETSSLRADVDRVDDVVSRIWLTLLGALGTVLIGSVGLIIKYILPARRDAPEVSTG